MGGGLEIEENQINEANNLSVVKIILISAYQALPTNINIVVNFLGGKFSSCPGTSIFCYW